MNVGLAVLYAVLYAVPGVAQNAPANATPGQANAQPHSVAVAPPMSVKEAARRFGLTLTTLPETVTVGQHFTVTVGVHVPAALQSAIRFPAGVDTVARNVYTSVTTSLSTGSRHDSVVGGFVTATETYQLVAWDVGMVPIGLADLVIGQTRINLAAQPIFVRSVLPKDSVAKLKAQPKEPRALFSLIVIVRRVVHRAIQQHRVISAIIALIALIVIVLLVLWRRSRRRQKDAVLIDWAQWAKQEFQRIEAMHLLENGEPERYAILMTNVLRESLVHQFPTVRASATTRELITVLQRESLIPAERTLKLFERVDMFKFAGLDSEVVEAETIGHEDQAIVDEIETRRQAEIAAREAAEQAAQQAALQADDEAEKTTEQEAA